MERASWRAGVAGNKDRPALDALAGRRVLVVEDDYFLADDIGAALWQAGASVVGPVPTLTDALARLSTPVDAAMLDICLRGEFAWPLVDMLLARGVPFLFATGYGPEVVPPAYAAVPHWLKPLDADELVCALSALVGNNMVADA